MLGVVSVPGREGGTFVLADLPGLIAGASRGAGLGHEFLRHVERTRLLIHVLDGSGGLEGRDPLEDFHTINAELAAYSASLAGKPQIVAVNKMDLPEAQANWPRIARALDELGYTAYPISAATGQGVGELIRATWERLQQLPRSERVAPPLRSHRVYTLDRSQERWEVIRLSPHHFALRGPKIERLTLVTDFSNPEAAERYQRLLARWGISRRLLALGIQPGDIVHVAGRELVWEPELAEAEQTRPRRRLTKRERLLKRAGLLEEPEEEIGEQ